MTPLHYACGSAWGLLPRPQYSNSSMQVLSSGHAQAQPPETREMTAVDGWTDSPVDESARVAVVASLLVHGAPTQASDEQVYVPGHAMFIG